MFSQEPEFLKGIETGVNSSNAMEALNTAVGVHNMMAQSIAAQAAPANQTGLQIAPTLGARTAGVVGETGRPLPEESIPQGQAPAGQVAGGEA